MASLKVVYSCSIVLKICAALDSNPRPMNETGGLVTAPRCRIGSVYNRTHDWRRSRLCLEGRKVSSACMRTLLRFRESVWVWHGVGRSVCIVAAQSLCAVCPLVYDNYHCQT
jgi:hypothetical protein